MLQTSRRSKSISVGHRLWQLEENLFSGSKKLISFRDGKKRHDSIGLLVVKRLFLPCMRAEEATEHLHPVICFFQDCSVIGKDKLCQVKGFLSLLCQWIMIQKVRELKICNCILVLLCSQDCKASSCSLLRHAVVL